MIPMDRLALEHEHHDDGENREGDRFLNHLQLHKAERAPVAGKADPVGRNGEAILKKGYSPGEQYDQNQRPARGYLHFT